MENKIEETQEVSKKEGRIRKFFGNTLVGFFAGITIPLILFVFAIILEVLEIDSSQEKIVNLGGFLVFAGGFATWYFAIRYEVLKGSEKRIRRILGAMFSSMLVYSLILKIFVVVAEKI